MVHRRLAIAKYDGRLTRAAYMQVRRGGCADACEERGCVGGIAAAVVTLCRSRVVRCADIGEPAYAAAKRRQLDTLLRTTERTVEADA